MKCPVCSSELTQEKLEGVVVGVCPNCYGAWFDAGEMMPIIRVLSECDEISPIEIKPFQRRDVRRLFEISEKNRLCPKCNEKLQKFNYCYDSNVFLDKCPKCKGIWTDGGEVERIAQYLKDDPRTTNIGRLLADSLSLPPDLGDWDSFDVP